MEDDCEINYRMLLNAVTSNRDGKVECYIVELIKAHCTDIASIP